MVKMVNSVPCILPMMRHHFAPTRVAVTKRARVEENVKELEGMLPVGMLDGERFGRFLKVKH